MNKFHKIEKVAFVGDKLVLKIDGRKCSWRLADISKKLANVSSLKRKRFEISPSGYGIHWPLIDEDLSIDALPRR